MKAPDVARLKSTVGDTPGSKDRGRSSTATHPLLQLQKAIGNQEAGRLTRAAAESVSGRETQTILHLQRTIGNQGVQPLLHPHREGDVTRTADSGLPPACSCGGQCPTCRTEQHRGYLGVAWCTEQGVPQAYVPGEHCAGDCVAQHEGTHLNDIAPCCERFGLCIGDDIDANNRCRTAWHKYMNRIDDWTECNAYLVEFDCLYFLLGDKCPGAVPGDGATEACCEKLDEEHQFVTDQISRHCPNAVPWPCPFASDGSIIEALE